MLVEHRIVDTSSVWSTAVLKRHGAVLSLYIPSLMSRKDIETIAPTNIRKKKKRDRTLHRKKCQTVKTKTERLTHKKKEREFLILLFILHSSISSFRDQLKTTREAPETIFCCCGFLYIQRTTRFPVSAQHQADRYTTNLYFIPLQRARAVNGVPVQPTYLDSFEELFFFFFDIPRIDYYLILFFKFDPKFYFFKFYFCFCIASSLTQDTRERRARHVVSFSILFWPLSLISYTYSTYTHNSLGFIYYNIIFSNVQFSILCQQHCSGHEVGRALSHDRPGPNKRVRAPLQNISPFDYYIILFCVSSSITC